MVDPQNQQLAGARHHASGQRHIDGHGAPFELGAKDGDIFGEFWLPRAPLTEHGVAVLEGCTVIAVPSQVGDCGHFQHRENVGLIALEAGDRQIVRAVDEGPRF